MLPESARTPRRCTKSGSLGLVASRRYRVASPESVTVSKVLGWSQGTRAPAPSSLTYRPRTSIGRPQATSRPAIATTLRRRMDLNYGPFARTEGGAYVRSIHERRRSEEHTSELQSPCNLVCRL